MDRRWKKSIWALAGIVPVLLLGRIWGRIALLLLVSATLAYLLRPLQAFFARRCGWKEGLSAGAAFAAACFALGAFALVGIPALARQAESLGKAAPQLMERYAQTVQGWAVRLQALGMPESAVEFVRRQTGKLLETGADFLMDKLMTVVRGVSRSGYLIFSPVLAYYLLRDRKRLFAFAERLIPQKIRRSVLISARSAGRAVDAYASGQLLVSVITGGLTALGLLMIGVDAWLLLGAVMMLCNLIPYFGPWLGAIPAALFAAGEGIGRVLMSLAVVFAAQQIEGIAVSPRVIGDAASLHPALVILTLIGGGWLAGLAGMFYSVPAVICLRAVLRAIREDRLRRRQTEREFV